MSAWQPVYILYNVWTWFKYWCIIGHILNVSMSVADGILVPIMPELGRGQILSDKK